MDALQLPPLTLATAKAGLAAGTTTTLTIGTTTPYCIRGKAFSRASVSNTATPTTDANTGAAFAAIPPNFGAVFVICLNAAGALRVVQSALQPLDASGNFLYAPTFPGVPDDTCPIGYLVTRVGATGAAWTFGASNLAGPPTGVTHTFVDVMTLPDRPQIS